MPSPAQRSTSLGEARLQAGIGYARLSKVGLSLAGLGIFFVFFDSIHPNSIIFYFILVNLAGLGSQLG